MKTIIFLFLISTFLFSCEKKEGKIVDNEQLIKKYFDNFNKHDFVKMSDMYIETAEFKDPSLGTEIVKQTREQTVKKYSDLNKIFPNLHDEIINIYPSGKKNIIVEFISTGTAPDKTHIELPICTIFTIENGLITKDFTYFDNFDESK